MATMAPTRRNKRLETLPAQPVPTVDMLGRIRQAARLRAGGQTWDSVAEALQYASGAVAKTCLESKYPDAWTREAYDAWRTRWAEAEGLALSTQTELLGTTDSLGHPIDQKVREAAAHSILATAARTRPRQVDVTHTHKLSLGDLLDVAARRRATRAALGALQDGARAKGLPIPTDPPDVFDAEYTTSTPRPPDPDRSAAETPPEGASSGPTSPGRVDPTTDPTRQAGDGG